MLETDCSISQIAHMVGYDDEHYFSHLFKRREGVSPSEFIAKCCGV
jgi:YesN/AraC family two-component response regulator